MKTPHKKTIIHSLKIPNNLIVVSDTHCGCRLALCCPEGIELDDGGRYLPSRIQLTMWKWWEEFWKVWVPMVTEGEPYSVVHNGDVIDGVHHNSTTQLSNNLNDQKKLAYKILAPVVKQCEASGGQYYHIRGTEAHVGKSAVQEEELAEMLGAIPNEEGQHARYDLWKKVGKGLVHCLHHIGTTSSSAHESSAVNAELAAEFVEAGRWGERPPDVIVRSHRHRCIEVRVPGKAGFATAIVTPAWQLKTPFAWKIPGARTSTPQLGGIHIRQGARNLYTDAKCWGIQRSHDE